MIEMVKRSKIKITVLKRYSPREVFEKDPAVLEKPMEICPHYSDGQEFVIDEKLIMPEGFCQSAWCSIYGSIRTLSFGGNFPWFKEEGVAINCCIDGLRPVIFRIERARK